MYKKLALVVPLPLPIQSFEGTLMIMSNRISSVLAKTAVVALCFAHPAVFAETPQERVHRMSHDVMPFEMSKTIHVFKMTESGGIQKVLARNPEETEQIVLIRQHLRHEAERFKRGDYSDPAELHGVDMPGLPELRASASAIEVSYSELPAGAQVEFQTKVLSLVTAVHRWFGAQLSEHGTDARSE